VSPPRVGLIGCGVIAHEYRAGLREYGLEVAACADLEPEQARAFARYNDVPRALSVDELIADESIEIALNLTPAAAHAPVTESLLRAGKHVYSEKPLAASAEQAWALVELAAAQDRVLACAPDTILGRRMQTVLGLVRSGSIGRPVGALGACLESGHERWHPRAEAFYGHGGGPLFDLGPYWLTLLVHLFGRVRHAQALGTRAAEHRMIGCDGAAKSIEIAVSTHVATTLLFDRDVSASLITSFDVQATALPALELYGTKGTLRLDEPLYSFNGAIALRRVDEPHWRQIPVHGREDRRGLGVKDLADAVRRRRSPGADGWLAAHVVEVMDQALGAAASASSS
jgi:predicted dehydrogenase